MQVIFYKVFINNAKYAKHFDILTKNIYPLLKISKKYITVFNLDISSKQIARQNTFIP